MSASSLTPTAVSILLVRSVLLSSLTNGQTTGSSGLHHYWEESSQLYCTSLCSMLKTPLSNMSSHRRGRRRDESRRRTPESLNQTLNPKFERSIQEFESDSLNSSE